MLLTAALLIGWQAAGAQGDPARSAPLLAEFFPTERNESFDYQFGRPDADMLIPALPGPAAITLRVMSPPPLPARELTLAHERRPLATVPIDGEIRTLRLLLPPAPGPHGAVLGLSTAPATVPGDRRELGVLLEDARVEPLAPQPAWPRYAAALIPPAIAFAALAALGAGWSAAGLAALAAALAAPVALAALAAGALDRLVLRGRGAARLRRLDDVVERASHLDRAAALAVAAYAVAFGWLSVAQHNLFGTAAYDLGLFDQWIWLISRGLPPYGTGVGNHALGDHAAVILYPLALLYAAAPDVRALLALQAIAVALGAVPLYLIGRARGAPGAGLIAALAYLLHPATHNMTLFDFHPDAIAGSALLLALLGWELRRWPLVVAGCAVVLACKENFAVTVAFFGLWVAAQRSWRLGIGLLVAGIAWFVLTTQLIVPGLSGQTQSVFVARFGQYGSTLPEIIGTIVAQPHLLVADLLGPSDLRFLWETLAPLALLPLLAPRTLVLALPATALNLLSSFPPQQTILYHYTALMVPLACTALLDAVATVGRLARGRGRLATAACALAVAVGTYGVHTTAQVRTWGLLDELGRDTDRPRVRAYVLAHIPPDAAVASQTWLHPHLTHRRQAFVFPNPFRFVHLVNPGAAPAPLAAEYIVYDLRRPDNTAGSFDEKVELLEALQRRGLYRPIIELDGVTLYRRADAPLPAECFGPGWEQAPCQSR